MPDTRDIIWEVRMPSSALVKSPTDPCGAKCSKCVSEWTCRETDEDCEVPYALHECVTCQAPRTYMPPYWLSKGVVIKDRRSQGEYTILATHLGSTSLDSYVEVLPTVEVQDVPLEQLRGMVIRMDVPSIETYFEPTSRRVAVAALGI